MDNPKVSVLIPMYNRKHYIEQCIDSALNQTFQENYEIIVRDNCSTDGGYEFVQEKYSRQIAEGKLRVYQNNENLGLAGSMKFLIKDSNAKYFTFLHSDDMFFPHALQHLYKVAEKTNADVVHQAHRFNTYSDGNIQSMQDCKESCHDLTFFDQLAIVPDDPNFRVNEWFNYGIYHDAQYNLFNREFILNNGIFVEKHDFYYSTLWWVMLAKILVKTPVACYVRRVAPDSGARAPFSLDTFKIVMEDMINSIKDMDRLFDKIEIFQNDEFLQYMIKAHYIQLIDSFFVIRTQGYKDGLTPELYKEVVKIFKKYFGEFGYFYPMFLFNWLHVMPLGKRVDNINFDISAPPPPPNGKSTT